MPDFIKFCETGDAIKLSNLIFEHRDELSEENYQEAVDAALKKKQIAPENKVPQVLDIKLLRVLYNFLSSIKNNDSAPGFAEEIKVIIDEFDKKTDAELLLARAEREKNKNKKKLANQAAAPTPPIVETTIATTTNKPAELLPEKDRLATQYNPYATIYSSAPPQSNSDSNADFLNCFDASLAGKFVLDLGCGAGYDMAELKKRGAIVFGIDAAEQMVAAAKRNNSDVPDANIQVARFDEKLPFADNVFDLVVSKWALQTALAIDPIFNEVARVLKTDGKFIALIGHPMCQFALKPGIGNDYFSQQTVTATFWDGKVTIQEPSHTMNDYLSPTFFTKFSLFAYREGFDRSGKKHKGDTVPNYFLLNANRK